MSLRVVERDATLITGCRILDQQGVFDSSGHLTYRVPNSNSFVISARKAPGTATLDDLMVIDEEGSLVEGTGTVPLEWAIHARIYRARPDVNSIIHSHSAMSRTFSISDHALRPVFGIAAPWLDHDIPVAMERGPVSSAAAGDRLAAVLGAGSGALLHAHGNVVVGPSIEATVVRAITLEQVAESLYRALSIGSVHGLGDDALDEWKQNTPAGHGKAWDYLIATLAHRQKDQES